MAKKKEISENTDYVVRLLEPIQFVEGGKTYQIGSVITVLSEKGKELVELKQAEKI